MAQVLFDKTAYMDRLRQAGMDESLARAHADAMDEALRESVATKLDVRLAVRDMTVRTGGMMVALFAALVSVKFFG